MLTAAALGYVWLDAGDGALSVRAAKANAYTLISS
jgi:hypothetical protein